MMEAVVGNHVKGVAVLINDRPNRSKPAATPCANVIVLIFLHLHVPTAANGHVSMRWTSLPRRIYLDCVASIAASSV